MSKQNHNTDEEAELYSDASFTGVIDAVELAYLPFRKSQHADDLSIMFKGVAEAILQHALEAIEAEYAGVAVTDCDIPDFVVVRNQANDSSVRLRVAQNVRCGKGWRNNEDYVSDSTPRNAPDHEHPDKITLRQLVQFLHAQRAGVAERDFNRAEFLRRNQIKLVKVSLGPDMVAGACNRYAIQSYVTDERWLRDALTGNGSYENTYHTHPAIVELCRKRKHKITKVLRTFDIVNEQQAGHDISGMASISVRESAVLFVLGAELSKRMEAQAQSLADNEADTARKQMYSNLFRYRDLAVEVVRLGSEASLTEHRTNLDRIGANLLEMRELRKKYGPEITLLVPMPAGGEDEA